MQRQSIKYWGIVTAVLCLVLAVPVEAMAEDVIVIGEINDTNQLVADGEIYDIADTPVGNDLIRNYIAVRVQVSGTITEGEELKIIRVTSFQVVDE